MSRFRFRVGLLAAIILFDIGLFLLTAGASHVYNDFNGLSNIVAFDTNRCTAIGRALPEMERKVDVAFCLSAAAAREEAFFHAAYAKEWSLFALLGVVLVIMAASFLWIVRGVRWHNVVRS